MAADGPRSLRDPEAVILRRAMLDLPHIAPLRDFARTLRAEGRGTVPEFDPMDGGIAAVVLFLMEKPGPMTDDDALTGRLGSGFISRNNDDPSAEATFRFMAQAGIDRRLTVTWNIVPWWNGTRRIERNELFAGTERLSRPIDLLPNLNVVVGVGRKAAWSAAIFRARGLPFIVSASIRRRSIGRRAPWFGQADSDRTMRMQVLSYLGCPNPPRIVMSQPVGGCCAVLLGAAG